PLGDGTTHRAVGRYDRAQRAELDAAARGFVNTDIPALSSGHQRPQLTIQHQRLAPVVYDSYYGWLVRARAVDADPDYDAVMVLFPNVVT
ncbi:hypothetical protein QOZ75_29530, partial [Pseudomonas aeruginosa]|uniref:hypothetical protein n=1 Tax=Pseudomonas aeruginosa TaxID=287 RepID=UPI0034585C9B